MPLAPTRSAPTPDSVRGERMLAIGIAAVLVVFRSLPFALFEQIQFDSDQAVFGLMAKHISEGRALPLFLYGQPYLLAIDAWLAAPWFLVAPSTVATLSIAIVLVNIATIVLTMLTLERWSALRPWHALIASLFLILPPPIIGGDLVSTSGANVYPFLYAVILWMLRKRPFWLGGVLAIGFMQREFTAYAVPALVAADLAADRGVRRGTIRKWLLALVMFFAVWEGIQALQPYTDLMGPGTRGRLYGGFAGSQLDNLLTRAGVAPSELGSRLDAMVRVHLPRLLGATASDRGYRVRPAVAWLLVAGFAAALFRLLWILRSSARSVLWRGPGTVALAWYLLAVGVLAGVVYVLARPVSEEHTRYGLLVLFVPVGIVGALLGLDDQTWARRGVVAAVVAWSALSAADTAAVYRRFWNAPPSDLRVLADALDARGIRSAWAPYWTAYAVSFLTGERVKVASTELVRIEEYQSLALGHPDAPHIREQPCAGGENIARWYLCRPEDP
jgi:hypothetical protein